MTELPLLQVRNLQQYFPVKAGLFSKTVDYVRAVDKISFDVYPGETVSLVGESGCGKSTTGKAILRLEEPTAGEVIFQGENILALSKKHLRKRRKDIQIIFQDPFASLNPRHTVGQILGEALTVQRILPKREQPRRIQELLEAVGLSAEHINRYPHEFSGGQRQRIAIARALAVEPKLIICDEAVSALDVSVQAQVLNLLKQLQREFNLTYLFISHDLSVVRYLSDRIMVMYLGKIVEVADKHSLFEQPRHPYTKALLSAIPIADTRVKKERILLTGDLPSPLNPPPGCRFQTRCPYVMEHCRKEQPEFIKVGPRHEVACHVVT